MLAPFYFLFVVDGVLLLLDHHPGTIVVYVLLLLFVCLFVCLLIPNHILSSGVVIPLTIRLSHILPPRSPN
jgi:uncharacterized membrane-anchored protein YitT (DUF2179 family)